MPDPKLRQIQTEIEAVLRKHDVTGIVLLASPSHADFNIMPSASWTAARIEIDQPTGRACLRVKCLKQDYPDREAQKKALENTVGMLMGWLDTIAGLNETLLGMVTKIGKDVEIQHRSHWEP